MAHTEDLLWERENPTIAEKTIVVEANQNLLQRVAKKQPISFVHLGVYLNGVVVSQDGAVVTVRRTIETQSREHLDVLRTEGWSIASEEILDLYRWH